MTIGELRELDREALEAKSHELDDQLFRMRVQQAMGQLEKPAGIRTVRRELARIKTLLNQKPAAGGAVAGSGKASGS